MMDRMKEYTSSIIYKSGEIIISNLWPKVKTDEHMMAEYIIDDGVPARGHRDIIYDKDYLVVGIGNFIAKNGVEYQVIDLAKNFKCEKCDQITCEMQKESGWSSYLKN